MDLFWKINFFFLILNSNGWLKTWTAFLFSLDIYQWEQKCAGWLTEIFFFAKSRLFQFKVMMRAFSKSWSASVNVCITMHIYTKVWFLNVHNATMCNIIFAAIWKIIIFSMKLITWFYTLWESLTDPCPPHLWGYYWRGFILCTVWWKQQSPSNAKTHMLELARPPSLHPCKLIGSSLSAFSNLFFSLSLSALVHHPLISDSFWHQLWEGCGCGRVVVISPHTSLS